MNERIAKFANQSGFDVDATGKFGNYSEIHRLEKFAQLIIAECVDAVKTTAVGYTKNGEDPATVAIRVDGALGVSAEIARRFRVLK